jgi:hypothetical protein
VRGMPARIALRVEEEEEMLGKILDGISQEFSHVARWWQWRYNASISFFLSFLANLSE